MRIEQLRYIVTVADSHSITIASEQLCISRQNISKAIKQLEEELSIKIFRRSNQGVFLTSNGQKLYFYAVEVLNKIDAIEKEFTKTSKQVETMQGTLSLNLHRTLYTLLSKDIQQFIEKYPSVQVDLYIQSNNNLLDSDTNLQEGIYGTSILKMKLEKLFETYPHYTFYCIKEETLKVVLSKHHVLANQHSLSLKLLCRYPAIFFGSENRENSLLNMLFLQQNMKPSKYLKTNDYNTALEIISSNKAYCFGSHYISNAMIPFANENLSMLPLSENIILSHILMVPKKQKNKKVIECFLELLNKHLGDTITIL